MHSRIRVSSGWASWGITLVLSACSSQAAPGDKGAATPGGANTAAVGSAAPVLTPSGVVSATPPASAQPLPSAQSPAPAEVPARKSAGAGEMCGGIAGITCAERLYCSFPIEARCGAGDMSGTCKPIPEMCTMEFAPVCGCDDKTYPSGCVAGRSGVSVRRTGACEQQSGGAIAEGKLCGTRGVPGECAEGLYCAYRAQCGATDAGGKCTKKPTLCPHVVTPVCGCDQQTYNNACEAARTGVSVATKGPCHAP